MINRSMPLSVIIPEIPHPAVREAVDWLCRPSVSENGCGLEIIVPN